MTDSYQIDNLLKAYSKRNKVKTSASSQKDELEGEKYADVVTPESSDKTAVYDKISHSLRDVLTKSRKNDT